MSSNLVVMSLPGTADSLVILGLFLGAVDLLFIIIKSLDLTETCEFFLMGSNLVFMSFPGFADSLLVFGLLLGAVDLVFIIIVGKLLH